MTAQLRRLAVTDSIPRISYIHFCTLRLFIWTMKNQSEEKKKANLKHEIEKENSFSTDVRTKMQGLVGHGQSNW